MKDRIARMLVLSLFGCVALAGCQDKSKAASKIEAQETQGREADVDPSETGDGALTEDVFDSELGELSDEIPPPPEMFGFECPKGTSYKKGIGGKYGFRWYEYWCEHPDEEMHGPAMRVSENYAVDSLLVTYRSGVRHGPYNEWNSAGKLTREGNFVDGKYEGVWLWYYYNGRVKHRCTFEHGVADATSMKDDFCAHWFDPKSSEDFELPMLDCPDGTHFDEVGYHRGFLSGVHITSTACVVSNFEDDSEPIKQGPAADYTRRGVKTYEGRYEDNHPIGKETRWYPRDELLSEGGWLGEGRRQGEWTFWLESGEVEAKCTFEKGALIKFEGKKKTCINAAQKEVPVPIY